MKVTQFDIDGLLLIEPNIFRDDRGFFLESYHNDRYSAEGLPAKFVQDNVSKSKKGVLRGLHYQSSNPQGKLISVLHGTVFDVAVDLRPTSKTFTKWIGITLSDVTMNQFYIPPGFAHGFQVLSDTAIFSYKCSEYYDPKTEHSLRWDDPTIDIKWLTTDVILSPKDATAELFDHKNFR